MLLAVETDYRKWEQEFFGYLPGFEAVGAVNDPHAFVINLVKAKLSSMTPAMMESFQNVAADVLAEEFDDSEGESG